MSDYNEYLNITVLQENKPVSFLGPTAWKRQSNHITGDIQIISEGFGYSCKQGQAVST